MGINIKSNTRLVNAKLVNATIDKYGASYPAQSPWRADGFNKVFVETKGANPTQKDFLEGNSSVYVYAIGSNIGSLLPYSLASFTNIKKLYLFSPTMVNIGDIDNDYLTYLTQSDLKIYVPSDRLQSYINTYGGTGKHLENRFDEITDDYPLTVSGSGDLTSQELTNQLMNNYESVDRTNCTKLIIQGFTNIDSIIWGYDFSEILPNLNNNIWVNGVKFDFSELTITGTGTLTDVDIDNAISEIAISNRGGVLEVKISGFSDMSIALEYDYEQLPNLEYVWLDNARYDIDNLENLIPGYQKVEYIESTGTQYIDSNIPLRDTTDLEMSFVNKGVYSSYESLIMINDATPSANTFTRSGTSNNFYVPSIANTSQNISQNEKYIFEAHFETNNAKWRIQGNQYIQKTTYSNDNFNYDTTIRFSYGLTQTYYFKIKRNDILVRDFIPCYRLSDDEIGLYDKVNKTFYTNSGTGVFLKGNDIGYKPTYFYPITDLEQEYNANLNQTFYLDYNGTLPSYPNYQLTYYTDINCTTSILPTELVSGTRYYVKCNGTYGLDFANESWENIKLALDNGVANYQLGDTKTITYNNATYTIRICDIGARYDITNGNGAKNHIVCEFVELVDTAPMNTNGYNISGWGTCDMKTNTMSSIYNNLPSDLKAVIEQVVVYSASGYPNNLVLTSSDNYLFLPSNYEIFGSKGYSSILELSSQYGLYQANNNNAFRIKNLNSIANIWWLRSPLDGRTDNFCDVIVSGSNDRAVANVSLGVAPFFCL